MQLLKSFLGSLYGFVQKGTKVDVQAAFNLFRQFLQLIRPMYLIREDDIIAWARYNHLEFIRCACRLTERAAVDTGASKRQEIKALIRALKRDNPDIEKSIFNSIHAVCLDTMPGWKTGGEQHSFLDNYNA